jgi:phosphotransacetylase
LIRSFEEILASAALLPSRRVVVAGAAKPSVIETMALAAGDGLIEPVLVGPELEIRRLAEAAAVDLGRIRLIDEAGDDAAVSARAVAELARSGAAMLMKGSVETGSLLHAALAPRAGLRGEGLLSHVAVTEIPGYPRLMIHTDGGINLSPDARGFRDILANAVRLARSLGNAEPRIACLALIEKVSDKLPETGAAAELSRWAASGALGPLICEGPVSWDIALSPQAAASKGIASEIAGATDIFLGPNTSAVNFVVKSLVYLAGARVAGLVLGARVPIVMLSRSDSSETRGLSLALGALYGDRRNETSIGNNN